MLSIGAAIADPSVAPDHYLDSLIDAGAVALFVELGQHLRSLPDSLVQAARRQGFPLVELRSDVRFVEITELIHARVLNRRFAQMQFAERVSDVFHAVMIEGADVRTVVEEAASLLESPVVLEDLGHRVIVVAGGAAEEVLREWEVQSRRTGSPHSGGIGPGGWSTEPVGPLEDRWGRLVVPRVHRQPDRVAQVLRRAADAICVLVRVEGGWRAIERRSAMGVLCELLGAPASAMVGLRARAAALGLTGGGAFAVLVAVAKEDADERLPDLLEDAARMVTRPTLVGPLGQGVVGIVMSGDSLDEVDSLVSAVGARLTGSVRTLAAADAVCSFDQLPQAVRSALHCVEVAALTSDTDGVGIWRPRDLGVRGLVRRLRDDPQVLAFIEDQLGPVLALPPRRREVALRALRAYVAADGSMAGFAAGISVSRPAAYDRIRRLSAQLGRDLTDPSVRLSVTIALLGMEQTDQEWEKDSLTVAGGSV